MPAKLSCRYAVVGAFEQARIAGDSDQFGDRAPEQIKHLRPNRIVEVPVHRFLGSTTHSPVPVAMHARTDCTVGTRPFSFEA